MRGIDAFGLAPPLAPFDPGAAPQLQWVPVALLVVDEAYQRPIRGAGLKNIGAIAEGFSWSKFAPLIVSPVVGGKYAVIDGQHRATAAALRGIEQLPAQVIIATQVQQAAAFKAVNGQTTRMLAIEVHRAARAAGDAEAMAVEAACLKASVRVLPRPARIRDMGPGETIAIGALRKGLERMGEADLVLALRLATATRVNNLPAVLSSDVIQALCGVVAAQAARVGRHRLLEAFQGIVIVREADKAAVAERPKGVALWELIRDRLIARLGEQLDRSAAEPSSRAA